MEGDLAVVLELGTSYYPDEGAIALDDVDGVVDVVTSGTVDVNTLGVYTLTYTALDNSGNQAIPAARTVFIVDTGKPTLELLGLSTLTHEAGEVYQDAGATAEDAVEGAVDANGGRICQRASTRSLRPDLHC